MLFFRNDYGQGCIQSILDLLQNTNDDSHIGYGEDELCQKAREIVHSKMPDNDVDIHFIASGTLTNQTILAHILRDYEAVIGCETAHIATHETGAIEARGHKVVCVPGENGKVTASAVRACFEHHMASFEHMVYPKVVYISNATELGSVYTRQELLDLRQVCDELNLYLFMDGARLGAALMSGVDYTLNDLARWCDVFYIGGTKNGALMGEAVIISNNELKPYFRFSQKQNGGLMAKGWLLGIQFIGLFEHDDFYKVAQQQNQFAQAIQSSALEMGYPLFTKSDTNQVFIVVKPHEYEYLKELVDFEIWDRWNEDYVIRLVTSWHTTLEEVDQLIVYLVRAKKLKAE